ncbi:MAG: helix-turn-helix domain-containing protein [Candidatus Puniceispirillales bacterium]
MSIKKEKNKQIDLSNNHEFNDTTVSDDINDAFDELKVLNLGQIFVDARLKKGITQEKVSTFLKVKFKIIKDFENGDEIDLPGLAYKIGFVRSYARFLDLDSNFLVDEFKKTLKKSSFKEEYKFLSPKSHTSKIFPIGSIVSLIIAIFVYSGWYYSDRQNTNVTSYSNEKESKEIIENADNLNYEIIEYNFKNNEINNEVLFNKNQNLALQEDSLIFQTESKNINKQNNIKNNELSNKQPSKNQVNELSAKANIRNPKNEMVLKSSGNSWVEIEDMDGNILLTRLMRPGETYIVPNISGLTINTGNAGVLSLSLGDVFIPKLGKVGEIISAKPLNINSFSNITKIN